MNITFRYLLIFTSKAIFTFFVFAFVFLNIMGNEKQSIFPGNVEDIFPQIKGILAKSDQEKVSSFQLLRQDVLNYLNKEYGKPFLAIEHFSKITNPVYGSYYLLYILDSNLVAVKIQNAGSILIIFRKLSPKEIAEVKTLVRTLLEKPEEGTKITDNDPISACWLFTIQSENENEYTHIPFYWTSLLKGKRDDENKTVNVLLKTLNELSKQTDPGDGAEVAKQKALNKQVWTFYEAHEKRMGLHLYAPEEEQEERKAQYMKARDESMKKDPPPPVDLKLDKETAIKIAETVLVKKYGERVLEQRPWKVTERDDHFVIIGTLFKDRTIARGGVADIVIDKTDGRVISITHSR